ncbi:outer membrane protein assembly factor BamD [Tenacibaculum jejuense]|uniref:Outer membrane assembly lipoprotein BamD n=1 Tax=Tenacibaculum jejuense TaxID=584609 RepID=A0A238U957_9FLAO|nr:outer membrane protein assembly factor BamD [Tenacibaculum jejuense]SNR15536.1 Outer membrane assembly lipoprotein precursor BamD [Tenacibaculum jejuense]
MKRIVYVVIAFLMLTSCGEYHRALNRGTTDEQYKMAIKMYEAEKYSRALRLFEKITPSYRGKPQMERIQYMVANSNLNEKNYGIAGYYFGRFSDNYPKSSKREEADFLSALSYYKATPSYTKDPTNINKAIDAFQSFIDKYPDSPKLAEANKYYQELRYMLESKAFDIAKNYYNTAETDPRNYRAAIVAFDNLLSDFLGTTYKEEALFYRLKAAHDLAVKSRVKKRGERTKVALKAYEKLKRNFPKTRFEKESEEMYATLKEIEQDLQKQLVKS